MHSSYSKFMDFISALHYSDVYEKIHSLTKIKTDKLEESHSQNMTEVNLRNIEFDFYLYNFNRYQIGD